MKNILVLLADIANGVFAVMLASLVTQTEVVWWYFLIGIPLAMCPDLDAIPELLKRGKVSASDEYAYDHRDILHFPVVFILLGSLLAWVFDFWGFVFLFATLLHFVNDLYGTGWGIPLFWPFTKKRYKVLGRRANRFKSALMEDKDWDALPTEERKLKLLVSWDMQELPVYITRWGIDDWIPQIYYRLNWISGIEYGLFIFACVLLIMILG